MEPGRGDIEHEPVCEVDVRLLKVADSPRISGENSEHVEALAAAQNQLPPIIVHRATMRVIDGLHRLRVAQLRGQDKIAVRFFDGDEANAFVLAVKSNIMHGLPLSLADRKHAAARIVASHPEWSDRMVASVTGIAAATVAEIRQRVTRGSDSGNVRIGQDGRARPVDGTRGRLLASQLIASDPSLSLRQIARAAGISPETARDVRNRLRRGEDPLPSRRKRSQAADHHPQPGRPAEIGGGPGPAQASAQDRAAVLERLRADPALRFSETGRHLLRLLNVLTIRAEEWDKIIDNVPPHCSSIVAQLARECAEIWNEFAARTELRAADMAYLA
ncbi:ParB N-terminal domain-containing protein [Streptomyces sp. 7-21]|nr:ParB N-terminal domain-containing protein [Streptomyces sp. 7-21]